MNDVSAHLIKELRHALLTLWSLDEIGEKALFDLIKSRAVIYRSVSGVAVSILRSGGTSTIPEEILIELASIDEESERNGLETIEHALPSIDPTHPKIAAEEKLGFLEIIADRVMNQIRLADSFAIAKSHLIMLDTICGAAIRIALTEELGMSARMDRLTRDFEHAYDEEVLRSLYEDIFSGEYP